MNRERQTDILVAAGISAPVVMLLACVSLSEGIFNDNMLYEVVGTVLAIVSVLAIVAGMAAAFSARKRMLGLGGLLGIAICIGLVFFTVIGIGAGQHHPPRQLLEACDTVGQVGLGQEATDANAERSPMVIGIDSIGVSMTLKSDMPHDPLLQRTLAQFVCEQMFFDVDDSNVPLHPTPVFQGDFMDFLKACALLKWHELCEATFAGFPTEEEIDADPENDGISRQAMQQRAAELAATDSIYQTRCVMTFRRVFDNDSVETWLNEYDIYVANTAHPSVGSAELTLRKMDGSIVILDN